MEKDLIIIEAKKNYKDNIEGEPLTEEVPITSFIAGAEFILKHNKSNYLKALKALEPIKRAMITMNLYQEWRVIVNALRNSAGLELIEFEK